jgi:hypothetical protein
MQDPVYMQHDAEFKAALVEYKAASQALAQADTPATWSAFNVARSAVAMASAQRNTARLAWLAAQKEQA